MTTKPMHLDPVSVAKSIDAAAKSAAPVAATETVAGVVKQAAHQANAAGANPTQAEYDALLAALVAAGIMAAS
jgi:hypothetical protein